MNNVHAGPRADGLAPSTRDALADLLFTMADDEFVSGFTDSEWTGIAPLLEEDVAMSSLSQDELGHAAALYGLLGELTDRGYEDAYRQFIEPVVAAGAEQLGR